MGGGHLARPIAPPTEGKKPRKLVHPHSKRAGTGTRSQRTRATSRRTRRLIATRRLHRRTLHRHRHNHYHRRFRRARRGRHIRRVRRNRVSVQVRRRRVKLADDLRAPVAHRVQRLGRRMTHNLRSLPGRALRQLIDDRVPLRRSRPRCPRPAYEGFAAALPPWPERDPWPDRPLPRPPPPPPLPPPPLPCPPPCWPS